LNGSLFFQEAQKQQTPPPLFHWLVMGVVLLGERSQRRKRLTETSLFKPKNCRPGCSTCLGDYPQYPLPASVDSEPNPEIKYNP